MTSEIFSRGQAFLAQGTDHFLNKMLSIRKVRLLITSRYIAMQSYECVIISKMFLIYFISYGCNGGALVFLRGAEASASPSFALPMFITIKKIIILHLFLGVPAATVGGTGTPWHTRGYAPVSPYKVIGAALGCQRGVSKMAAERHVLKRLWLKTVLCKHPLTCNKFWYALTQNDLIKFELIYYIETIVFKLPLLWIFFKLPFIQCVTTL